MEALAVLAAILLVVAPILGVIGFFRALANVRRIETLKAELADARSAIAALETRIGATLRTGQDLADRDSASTQTDDTEQLGSVPRSVATEDPAAGTDQTPEIETPGTQDSYVFTDEQLDAYDAGHLEVLDQLLGPRADATIADQQQRDLRTIAEKIRAKLGLSESLPDSSLVPFLKAFAAALRQRLDASDPSGQTKAPTPPAARAQQRGLEEILTSQWMVWLGAAAVALSVVFLVSYAAEQGWLGPEARIFLGIALGVALILGGEWLYRHPAETLRQAVNPDYVPPALTASGLFGLFVSIFAAHGIFELIPATLAFAALGLVAGCVANVVEIPVRHLRAGLV